MLTDLMGGEMTVRQHAGPGQSLSACGCSCPQVHRRGGRANCPRGARVGYVGPRRRILMVDNEEADRELLAQLLAPLGFQLAQAAVAAQEALEVLAAASGRT